MSMPAIESRWKMEFFFRQSEKDVHLSYLDIMQYEAVSSVNGKVEVEHVFASGDMGAKETEVWLSQDPSQELIFGEGEAAKTMQFVGALRIIYGIYSKDELTGSVYLPMRELDFNLVKQRLGIPPQFLYTMQRRTGSAYKFSCPKSTSSPYAQDGFVPFLPKTCYITKYCQDYYLAQTTSKDDKITYGFLLVEYVNNDCTSILHDLETSPELSLHPMYLPTLLAVYNNSNIEGFIGLKDTELDQWEIKMGQTKWAKTTELGDPLKANFAETGKDLNHLVRLSAMDKSWMIAQGYTLTELAQWSKTWADREEAKRINELLHWLIDQNRTLLLKIEYGDRRAQSLVAVVYSYAAQKDSKINIELASTSTNIAKETKKDASAMKTIAILTMVFLPATTVAGIFAMPVLNWEDHNQPVISDKFPVYWIVTIPLTILVLGIWCFAIFAPWRRWLANWVAQKEAKDLEAGLKKE